MKKTLPLIALLLCSLVLGTTGCKQEFVIDHKNLVDHEARKDLKNLKDGHEKVVKAVDKQGESLTKLAVNLHSNTYGFAKADEVNAQFNTVDGKFKVIDARFNAVNEQLKVALEQISVAKSLVEILKNKKDASSSEEHKILVKLLTDLTLSIGNLGKGSTSSDVATLVGKHEAEIANLKAQVNGLNGQTNYSQLSQRLGVVEAATTKLQGEMVAVQATQGSHQDQINKIWNGGASKGSSWLPSCWINQEGGYWLLQEKGGGNRTFHYFPSTNTLWLATPAGGRSGYLPNTQAAILAEPGFPKPWLK